MPMLNKIKFNADTVLAFRLRQIALREGRTVVDVVRWAVERGIEDVPATVADGGMVQVEKGINKRKPRIAAAYLSDSLASAVHRLAEDQRRSVSWVMRDLIRCELRRRGALPAGAVTDAEFAQPTPTTTADAAAE